MKACKITEILQVFLSSENSCSHKSVFKTLLPDISV